MATGGRDRAEAPPLTLKEWLSQPLKPLHVRRSQRALSNLLAPISPLAISFIWAYLHGLCKLECPLYRTGLTQWLISFIYNNCYYRFRCLLFFFNTRHMRQDYCSWFVCLSVTTLAATYLICESNLRCCKVPYGVPNSWFVWISPKTLCSPVLASFADFKLLDFARASDSIA